MFLLALVCLLVCLFVAKVEQIKKAVLHVMVDAYQMLYILTDNDAEILKTMTKEHIFIEKADIQRLPSDIRKKWHWQN